MNIQLKLKIFPYLLVLFEMATYLSSDMYLPALPNIMHQFSISESSAQSTLTAWFLGSISVQLILGPLADRYGRKTILCIGTLIFTIATFMCAIAANFTVFLIARFIQGSSICFMAVPGYASIHESYAQKEAIKLLAVMGSITVLAPSFGPMLGSVILLFLNWRTIFLFLVILSIVSSILLFLFMPETLPIEKRLPLHFSSILKNYWQIVNNTRFLGLICILGLLLCGFLTWITAGPFLVIEHFHHSPFIFSIYQCFIFASLILSNFVIKRLIDYVKIAKLINVGLFICFSVSILNLYLSIKEPQFLFSLILTYIIYAFGTGLTFAPLNRLIIETAKEGMGTRMAVFSMFMSSFATLNSILVSLFYNNTLLSISSIICVVTLMAYLLKIRFIKVIP